jgi:flavin reductase (DIM6/NTAB) family NADH-FMN oxidoreductase RutF
MKDLISIPVVRAFTFLEAGPVVLLSTSSGGKNNIMTLSWHMVLDFDGEIALCTGPWNESFDSLIEQKECVIAVPPATLLEKVVRIGMCDGSSHDKFREFGLTPLTSEIVKAPLIKECLASFECRVTDYFKTYGIVVMKIEKAWMNPKIKDRRTAHAVGDGTFEIDGAIEDYRVLMESKIPHGV